MTGMRVGRAGLVLAAAAVMTAGCGSAGRPAGNGTAVSGAQKSAASVAGFEQALVSQTGATRSTVVDGDIYDLPGGDCTVYVLSGSAAIRLYQQAGDPVVTDRSGRLGAKVACSPAGEVAGLSQVAAVLKGY